MNTMGNQLRKMTSAESAAILAILKSFSSCLGKKYESVLSYARDETKHLLNPSHTISIQ